MNKVLTELWDFFKRNFAILLIGTLFLIFYFGSCNNKAILKPTHDTTTVTTQVPQPIVIVPPYQPTQNGSTVYVPIPQNAQGVIPASTFDGLLQQVKDLSTRIETLGNNYYAIKHYEDSIQLKDSSGKRVGVVNLNQTVSENTLKSTQPTYQLSFPYTIKTITNTIPAPLKNQVFVGIGTESVLNKINIQGVDLGLLLKNKKDNVFSLSGTYDLQTKQPGIQVGFYKKIKL